MTKKRIIIYAVIFFVLGVALTFVLMSGRGFSESELQTAIRRTWCFDFNGGSGYWGAAGNCQRGGGWFGTKDHSSGKGIKCDWQNNKLVEGTCGKW